ncbi:TPA: PqqD family peptide modification chaperone, partial [Staphylococcus pseudintermedius]|nr:PqqD family peptide modification chaperone [Staphylococcus pseudintermedius]
MIENMRLRKDLKILFNPKNSQMHRLDDIGVLFAEELQKNPFDTAVSNLSYQFNVPKKEIYNDLLEFKKQVSNDIYPVDFEIEKRHKQSLEFPLRLEIEVTSLCNWNCGFCYNVWKIDPSLSDKEVKEQIKLLPQKHLPKETIFKILREASENGCLIVRYSGGETLLHPDIKEILDYGGKLGLYQIVFTNGHFINDSIIKNFKKNNVGTVLISLHGDKTTHNFLTGHKLAYDRAINAIEKLSASGIDVVTELTLVKGNIQNLKKVVLDAYEHGSKYFSVMRYVPTGKNDEKYAVKYNELSELIENLDNFINKKGDINIAWPCGQKMCLSEKDNPVTFKSSIFEKLDKQFTGSCESGITWASISFDGKLRNCPHSNVYFGDVSQNDITSLWKKMTKKVHEALQPRSSCSGCEFLSKCQGGCHLEHFFD